MRTWPLLPCRIDGVVVARVVVVRVRTGMAADARVVVCGAELVTVLAAAAARDDRGPRSPGVASVPAVGRGDAAGLLRRVVVVVTVW